MSPVAPMVSPSSRRQPWIVLTFCLLARISLVTAAAAAEESCAADVASAASGLAADFARDGYTILRGMLTSEEVDKIEAEYDRLTHPTPELAALFGKDYGDQSQGYGTDPANFTLINVNSPGNYVKGFTDNVFVRKASEAARALLGEIATMDYEQLLEKRPGAQTAAFPWHQDMQYWPKRFPADASTATATFSLALSDSDEGNGCLRVLTGSGAAKRLWSEEVGEERAIKLTLKEEQLAKTKLLEVRRGDVTVHDEWIVHGSAGNPSERVRKTYVVAFRDAKMVEYERSIGFAHSYNNDPEVMRRVRAGEL